jgi:hypothetical protein
LGGNPTERGSSPIVLQPEGCRVADEHAQDAAPVREISDRGVRCGVDPGREEPLERLAGLVDHAQGRVARRGELRGRLDDPLEQRVERQLGAEGDARVDEHAQAVALVRWAGHRHIVCEA